MIRLRQLTFTHAPTVEPAVVVNNEPVATANNSSKIEEKDAIKRLKRSAWLLIVWFILLLLFSIAFLVWGLEENVIYVRLLMGLCLVSGLCGSTIAVLISLVDRFSNGWELEDGKKVPENDKRPDRFGQRMIPWFVIRPFLGAVMGLAVYLGFSSRLLFFYPAGGVADLESTALRLTFFALLAGLFAKSFLESLKRAFAAFVGETK